MSDNRKVGDCSSSSSSLGGAGTGMAGQSKAARFSLPSSSSSPGRSSNTNGEDWKHNQSQSRREKPQRLNDGGGGGARKGGGKGNAIMRALRKLTPPKMIFPR